MADTLIERVTGRTLADGADVEIRLVMDPDTLFGHDDQPATLDGYGPIPAALARDLATHHTTGDGHRGGEGSRAVAWIRRLYQAPDDTGLVRMDSHRRRFPTLLAQLIRVRDQTCRTPYCDAPIRHLDHITRRADGGATSYTNGQGLCAACNYRKEHPDWTTTTEGADSPDSGVGSLGHAVTTRTPTGHTYTTGPPPLLPGRPPHKAPPTTESALEQHITDIIWHLAA